VIVAFVLLGIATVSTMLLVRDWRRARPVATLARRETARAIRQHADLARVMADLADRQAAVRAQYAVLEEADRTVVRARVLTHVQRELEAAATALAHLDALAYDPAVWE